MAAPRVRYDAYGKPLPTLADAREQSLVTSPSNEHQRGIIRALLEEQYQALLRRGTFVEVTLTFRIHDGSIQAEMDLAVRTHIGRG